MTNSSSMIWPTKWSDRALLLLVTGFGSGLSPVAPGTFGTIPGVLVGILAQAMWPPEWAAARGLALFLSGLALLLLLVGCSTSRFVARVFAREDPGAFVLDEIVGYLLALSVISALQDGGPTPTAHAACFILFRIFDVLKPPPARRLEELPGALGIMMDDVAAGLYAALALWGLHSFDLLP